MNDQPTHSLRATQEDLDRLHRALAEVLVEQITLHKGRGQISMRLLGAAMSFLKLNGVITPEASQSKIDELVHAMPNFDSLGALPEASTDDPDDDT